jgi:hypothetical protein
MLVHEMVRAATSGVRDERGFRERKRVEEARVPVHTADIDSL